MTSDRPLRIVHVCPRYAPAPGGAELFFTKISTALAHDGHDVSVWTTTARSVDALTARHGATLEAGEAIEGGVRVRRFPLWHPPLRRYLLTALHPLPFGRTWRASTLRWTPLPFGLAAEAARRSAPLDVVHGAALPYSSLIAAAVRLARRSGARLVLTPFAHLGNPGDHGNRIRRTYLSPLNVSLLREADVVLVQTRAERDALASAGVDADRLRLVGMGVDAASCTNGGRERARARWALGDGPVVGHLANKSADKGTVDLLEASARAWQQGAQFRVLLAGEEMQSFRSYWRGYAFKDRVVNLAEISADEKRDFFAAIDVFALPSYVESFGITLLEAAANALPAIAYRLGGPAEILHDGLTGRLVPPGDVAALAVALQELTGDDDRRRAVGQEALRRSAGWTWDRVLDTVKREYHPRGAGWSHEHRPDYCRP